MACKKGQFDVVEQIMNNQFKAFTYQQKISNSLRFTSWKFFMVLIDKSCGLRQQIY